MREFLGVLGRRRAWWIVPTVGGLVVGVALMALVPRKFVVSTAVEILPTYAEELTSRGKETTLDKELGTVQTDLKSHTRVRKTLEQDPRPEFAVLLESGKYAQVEQVRARIDVNLAQRTRPGGEVVYVVYRDHDKYFAAKFLNALVKGWMEDLQGRIRRGILGELQSANGRVEDRTKAYEEARERVRDFLLKNGLPPDLATGSLSPPPDPVSVQLATVQLKLDDKEAELEQVEKTLAKTREQRDEVDPTLVLSPIVTASPPRAAGESAVEALLRQKLEGLDAKLTKLRPAHPQYAPIQRERDRCQRELSALLRVPAPASAPGAIRQANPVWREKDAEVKDLESKLVGLRAEVEKRKERQAALLAQNSGRPALYSTLEQLKQEMRTAEDSKKEAVRDEERIRRVYLKVEADEPFLVLQAANPPLEPTEPDLLTLFVVSLLVGGGLGLTAASVREYARTSYRTLEDAARSLPVPVLGAVAWVRTEVERRRSRRWRLLATFATSTAAALLTALFVAYSVKPQSLPLSVSTFLDSIRRSLR
ncbi:MAG TPA: hypothetical protein VFI25_13420 [Planctomycetota bacterium]|jgi:uncharacterized protein involved in exopolysaccharide biosynthesis|nr:hypothetical protein [Planctomycetota bacterium]